MLHNFKKTIQLLTKPKGFIAIMALGVFGLLTVFGIVVSKTSTNSIQSVIETNDYYAARDVANSTVEYLEYQLHSHDAGFNFNTECDENELIGNLELWNVGEKQFCGKISQKIGDYDFKIQMKIKGAPKEDTVDQDGELFGTGGGTCPNSVGGANGCYVVPFPGTGDAGKNCELYDPIFKSEDANSANLGFNTLGQQLDHIAVAPEQQPPPNNDGQQVCADVPGVGLVCDGDNEENQGQQVCTQNMDGDVVCENINPNSPSSVLPGGIIDAPEVEGSKQLDHPCNWNKLVFGSNLTDRVAIPFYTDSGSVQIQEDGTFVNQFNINNPFGSGSATNFALRLRTPCKKCAEIDPENPNAQTEDNEIENCSENQNPTICDDDDRYYLDDGTVGLDGTNEIVVQWQLTGLCPTEDPNSPLEECGLVQYDSNLLGSSSSITETRINTGDNLFSDNMVLTKDREGVNINNYSENISIGDANSGILTYMQQPLLTLFLSEKLVHRSDDNILYNVPYLEYQILTDKPIGNPKTEIEVYINVNGNIFKKTISKQIRSDIIDFAVQN